MKSGSSVLYPLACTLSPTSYLWDGGIFCLPHTPDYIAGSSVSSVPQSEEAALVGVRQAALFRSQSTGPLVKSNISFFPAISKILLLPSANPQLGIISPSYISYEYVHFL